MDSLEFRQHSSSGSQSSGGGSAPPSRRERLAIISTTNKLCGIAAYTASLEQQLGTVFEVTVFDLDQYLLRSRDRRVVRIADRHVMEICRQLSQFDAVNLQLEHGTLGRRPNDIYRRFCWLVDAAPRLSVTFHTLLLPPRFPAGQLAKALLGLDFRAAAGIRSEFRRHRLLSLKIAARLRRVQRYKQVAAIVHTRRNHHDAAYLYGIDNVFDHPLSFLSATQIEAARDRACRRDFPVLDRIPEHATLIGVFGFINYYKGLSTVIKSLHHLPADHHLLIFGGIHPNEIARERPIHPYLASLLDDAYVGTTPYDQISGGTTGEGAPKLVLDIDHSLGELLGAHPRDLSTRIHFMGALGDREFLAGMASCDVVVFPYLEVGQSSSGPISQALELGCRIIATRTHAFLGFAEYHKDAVEFFDIGNYLELAERILARRQFPPRNGLPDFNVETNKAIYLAANGGLPPRQRRSVARPGRTSERAERDSSTN